MIHMSEACVSRTKSLMTASNIGYRARNLSTGGVLAQRRDPASSVPDIKPDLGSRES